MITLIEILSKDLTEGKNAYGEAFQQCFEIDYVASVASVFHKHLAHTTNDVMKKIDRMLYKDAAGEGLKKHIVEVDIVLLTEVYVRFYWC